MQKRALLLPFVADKSNNKDEDFFFFPKVQEIWNMIHAGVERIFSSVSIVQELPLLS